MLLVTALIPGIGIALAGVVLLILKLVGYASECRLPIRRRIMEFCGLYTLAILLLLLGGNILSAYGLYNGEYSFALLGLTLSLIAFSMSWAFDRFLLRSHIVSSEFIAFEKINADYLDRLTEFPYPTNDKIFTLG